MPAYTEWQITVVSLVKLVYFFVICTFFFNSNTFPSWFFAHTMDRCGFTATVSLTCQYYIHVYLPSVQRTFSISFKAVNISYGSV